MEEVIVQSTISALYLTMAAIFTAVMLKIVAFGSLCIYGGKLIIENFTWENIVGTFRYIVEFFRSGIVQT